MCAGEGRDSCSGRGRKIYFFDLETQRLAEEVGGWQNKRKMLVSVAVLYDYEAGTYRTFTEAEVAELVRQLESADLVVGFNIRSFDYEVLRAYTDMDFSKVRTLDILEVVHGVLKHRLSLDHLVRVTLGEKKLADGLQAVEWFRNGEMARLAEYCTHDVAVTLRLFEFGRKKGYLLYEDRGGGRQRIPVRWAL